MKWRIYYDDGNYRSHIEGLPETADQRLGIICVAQISSNGKPDVINGGEYYLFDGQFWIKIGMNGLEDWAMNKLRRMKCVIKGRAIEKGEFNDIYVEARQAVRKGALD